MTTITAHHADLSPRHGAKDNHTVLAAVAVALLVAVDIGGFAKILTPARSQVAAQALRPSVTAPALPPLAPETRAVVTLPESISGFAPVNLVCEGDAVLRQAGNHMAEAAPSHASIEVQLSDGNARIHLPDGFDPNSAAGGWYKVKYFATSADDVNGNAVISFVDKPFFSIDRVSGQMDVRGLGGSFSGQCKNVPSEAQL